MAVTFTCTCGRQLRVSDAQAGKSARCPACGRVMSAPDDQTAIWPAEPHESGSGRPRHAEAETETLALEPTYLTRQPPAGRSPAPAPEVPAPAPEPPRTSRKAVIALVLGLLSPLLCIVGGVMAVFWGVLALGEIRRSENQLQGEGYAIAGIILGVVGILTSIAALSIAIILTLVSTD
jgi:hypothetical protein